MVSFIDRDNYPLSAILTDYEYWAVHESELDLWLKQFNDPYSYREGMIVMFGEAKILTAFLLRWQ